MRQIGTRNRAIRRRLAGGAAVSLLLLGCGSSVSGSATEDAPFNDRVSRVKDALAAGDAELRFEPSEVGRGYLRSLLDALEISPDSQTLVFSKTSFQIGLITAATPRAIYFNDDTYVAWEQGGRVVEIVSMHPKAGPHFYALPQKDDVAPKFKMESALCLRCHDSKSMSGDGYPRLLIGSGISDELGNLASHEGWSLTDPTTPIAKRWGGWFVTGSHGTQKHLGNRIARLSPDKSRWEVSEGANLDSLDTLLDTAPYVGEGSDLVALLVLEHQIDVQNRLTELHRIVEQEGSDSTPQVEALADALLFVDEARLGDRVRGSSGFAERFEKLGPSDDRGRSLRTFNLETRVFQYPLSYLIASDMFLALPEEIRADLEQHLEKRLTMKGPLGRAALEIWSSSKR